MSDETEQRDAPQLLTAENMAAFVAQITISVEEADRLAKRADTLSEPVEMLTLEEQLNLANFFTAIELAIQREEQSNGVPLLGEYCWVHVDQPQGGGWCCAVCHAQQQAQKRGDGAC